uniref:Geranylgeranyl transferase type I subunit beta n=1 Tax=Heterorhabditis bacteriophora TaxID=37862 RepID=A0A1I7XQ67_HETBA
MIAFLRSFVKRVSSSPTRSRADTAKKRRVILNCVNDIKHKITLVKITLLFFAVSALDLVGELDTLLTKERRKAIIDWIYRLQITSDSGNYWCGFRGGLGCVYSDDKGDVCSIYDAANLAQTYSALLSLAILGDDLSKVDRCAILNTISKSQKDDGSFWGQGKDSESDMRFVFCATAICHILNDDNAINWSRLSQFIRASLNYDGGIGQGPGDESHGGSTYCAIASLALSNRLWNESVLSRKEIDRLIKWAVWKQERGFHGRAHKPDDSCYAFWIGATLEILNAHPFINDIYLREFLMIAQHEHLGGFCKIPEKGGFPGYTKYV